MALPKDTILKVEKPLYGVLKAGNYWFMIYYNHYINKLGLTISIYNLCLLYRDDAIVGLQIDDSLIMATPKFMTLKAKQIK